MDLAILTTISKGFFLGGSLIVAIGAQNAFVLRQGLAQRHVFVTALVSALSDIVLIALGVGGVGALIAGNELLKGIATWGGFAFLVVYGLRAFRSAARAEGLKLDQDEDSGSGLRKTVFAALAFSLLNPHAILDTVVLIGSVGAQYPAAGRWWFGGGAMAASVVWFFGLAYGATRLTPVFQKPRAGQALDVLIGMVMWGIAVSLVWG